MADQTQPVKEQPKTIDAFDATVQKVVPHVITIDDNMEYVLTAPSGHFIKIPQTVKDLKAYLKDHFDQNVGQITQAEIDAVKKAALDKI